MQSGSEEKLLKKIMVTYLHMENWILLEYTKKFQIKMDESKKEFNNSFFLEES
ncbi:hypothetical protein WN51_11114 [Melipona quadrifasciata]|uniref:Uncharacterized protein n=1 Tax=Melipona quadrifasciata TaxID=166423 RepID=A0A0N0U2N4_9HYME|nr:hypothetical protein WN51_11114 [Melipona quadrifasciata]